MKQDMKENKIYPEWASATEGGKREREVEVEGERERYGGGERGGESERERDGEKAGSKRQPYPRNDGKERQKGEEQHSSM